MAPQPRIFLFHGNDTYASSRALKAWIDIFAKKYGELARFFLDADEHGEADFAAKAGEYLQSGTLFDSPKLVVIRRVTAHDTGRSFPHAKRLIDLVASQSARFGESVTLVVWEPKALPASHPLLAQFQRWQDSGAAGIKNFSTPNARTVINAANAYLERYGAQLQPDAGRWLADQYGRIERRLRMEQRLKNDQQLSQDERSWWLYHLLDGASLRAKDGRVGIGDLQSGLQEVEEPVSAFSLATAVTRGQWREALRLLAVIEREADEGTYFGLLAALRWQAKRGGESRLSRRILERAAEMEVIMKNYPLQGSWLFDALVLSLERGASESENHSIVDRRKLWLANIQRS